MTVQITIPENIVDKIETLLSFRAHNADEVERIHKVAKSNEVFDLSKILAKAPECSQVLSSYAGLVILNYAGLLEEEKSDK